MSIKITMTHTHGLLYDKRTILLLINHAVCLLSKYFISPFIKSCTSDLKPFTFQYITFDD